MRVSVLGACGVWPQADEACSGFLVEHDGFRLLLDVGYATLPRMLRRISAEQVDAVFVSHGHPDHCADLNPLLRARALGGCPARPLPVYAPAGALDAVLALDRPRLLDGTYVVHEVIPGAEFELGPFQAATRLLPHWEPNAGIRLVADGRPSGPDSSLAGNRPANRVGGGRRALWRHRGHSGRRLRHRSGMNTSCVRRTTCRTDGGPRGSPTPRPWRPLRRSRGRRRTGRARRCRR
ncbi:Beta-lactamase superfamily domain-containing protein [Paractinoplanes atraurantiacus]|uniref:Beta-lactamase superfamily domain-containing protein n=1 Tax=Paractinoplanes atraurantiacus TaxID=1036182 RepID=A0A285GZD1_9ACTN|nr:Beta-lactamase superfamily domain-containing protein [Actinoplanes atraurantiacus]